MASLDRELRAIAARGSNATVTPDSLVGAVTARAARRRAGRLAGATVAALAAAGFAATAAISLGHHAPPATPPDKVLGTVTLPFDPAPSNAAEPPNPLGIVRDPVTEPPNPLGLACGDRAPTPVTSAGGLEWLPRSDSSTSIDNHTATVSDATIRGTLRNTTGDSLPAAVSSVNFVIVHDGVVAGWTEGNGPLSGVPGYHYLDSGPANRTEGSLLGSSWTCPKNSDQGQLAVGDYEVYPVLHVSASPADAARQWLRLAGYSVPTDDPKDLAIYTPGSWDCGAGGAAAAALASGGTVAGTGAQTFWLRGRSLLCASETPAGASVNRDTRTITLPYTSRLYTRSLDVTLVGEPLTYTIRTLSASSVYLGYQGLAAEPIADPAALQCGARLDVGAVFATGRTSSVIEAGALNVPARTRFESGTVIDLALVPQALSARGTIAYPAPMRVWFLGHPPGNADDLGALEEWYVVVGTATATVNRGEPVALDRFAGPSATSVAFTDVRWCDAGASSTTSLVMFEGTERLDDGTGARESTILDGWTTDITSWLQYGGN